MTIHRFSFAALAATLLFAALCLPSPAFAQAGDSDVDQDGFSPNRGDCNDQDDTIFPGAPELCDSKDNDCDGVADNPSDDDGDGRHECNGDCDDSDDTVRSGFSEICDAAGKDNDCNPNTLDTSLTRSCYGGPAGTAGVGQCTRGTESCSGSGWSGVCQGEVTPTAESCNGLDDDCDRSTDEDFDDDNDGFADENANCTGGGPFDCDDDDDTIYPGAPEACDGVDSACDGDNDSLLERSCYTGPSGTLNRGICEAGTESCTGTAWSGSCVGETTPVPNLPNGDEAQCDGLDDDCDGDVDEDYDADGDGYVDETILACASVPGPLDCDDNDRDINPGRTEVCDDKDNNCDGRVDEGDLRERCYSGPDGTAGRGICRRGWQQCINGLIQGPCVDEVTPEPEACDERDNDCDGDTDEDFDLDGDGFVTDQVQECLDHTFGAYDCLDTDPDTYPGARERCDGVDNACDGDDDAELTRPCYTADEDTLDVGICVAGTQTCSGTTWEGQMCVGEVTPEADEAAECNGLDDDCDGEVDETFDEDEDGFTTCAEPVADCDDTNPDVNPDAAEVCNAIDDDCDGTIDGVLTACYTGDPETLDVGSCTAGTAVCENGQPVGECQGEITPVDELARGCNGADDDCDGIVDEDFDQDADGVSTCAGDCDDDDYWRRPGIPERCDCKDNDCDGEVDIIQPGNLNICDFGACRDLDDDGFTNCEGDCDDQNLSVNPGLPELCGDGLDNDCDGLIDEDVDEDGDLVTTCDGDCDDRFASIRPELPEFCDGFDNNCNGVVDEGFDEDGDFATICQGDCDDNDPTRNPFNREVCGDGIDNDCDGVVDPDFDSDGDGFTVCTGDCNDFNASVYPGAEEVCDGLINDCDCVPSFPGECLDRGFDQDGDLFSTCFGDCDDGNPDINPSALEVADDGVDNNCNGLIDEGNEDADGDGVTFLCGDCDDTNASVSPNTEDICDGFDNDCDGQVDRTPWGELTCDVCNDADEDGVQDCDGDCDDTNPDVRPGGQEVCDGLDNDCDGTVDLDRVTGENLCTAVDGGLGDGSGRPDARADAGVGPGSDLGGPSDGALAPDAGQSLESAPVEVGCSCSAAASGPSRRDAGRGSLLALAVLGALWFARARRRPSAALAARRRAGPWVLVFIAGAAVSCSSVDFGGDLPGADAGSAEDAEPGDGDLLDAASTDADVGPSADAGDADRADSGPLNEGPCRLLEPEPVVLQPFPGTNFRLALHDELAVSAIDGVDALALDDVERGVRGFALGFELSETLDARDPGVADQVIDRLLDPALDDGVPGVVGVAAQIDESLRQRFVVNTHAASRTLRRVTMVNDVLVSRIRDGLLADVAKVGLGSISGLPRPEDETVTRSFVLQAMAVVDERDRTATVVVLVVAETSFDAASTLMSDLTNGTHVGDANEVFELECEDFVADELAVDFIWVVDNSSSMQEEQEALVDAAETFFAALEESQIDYRLGVITTDGETLRGGSFTTSIDAFRERVQVGINGEGNEAGLEYALRAIDRARDPQTVDERQRLRADAVPVLIFFSDEDSLIFRPLEDYIGTFESDGVLPFAIVGPRPRGCLAVGRGFARLGANYIRVVEALGGTTASICSSSLDEPVREILVAAAGAASSTRLDETPISGTLEVQLATSTVARSRLDGFDYEPTANSMLFFGDANLPVGTDFRVGYQRFRRLEN